MDLAIADLDEDGPADLAVANHETNHVTLLFGIAGEAFEHRDHSRFRVDVSLHPHAVRLHDIDADAHADLLVEDRSPESIRLFRGRGDGTFSGATSIDVGGDPYRGMSLADVTGDGLADLITPNPDLVAVLVAEEDGGFRPRATLPAPSGPFSVGAADLNGDGSGEVLVASYAGGEVAVLVGAATPLVVALIRRRRRASACLGVEGGVCRRGQAQGEGSAGIRGASGRRGVRASADRGKLKGNESDFADCPRIRGPRCRRPRPCSSTGRRHGTTLRATRSYRSGAAVRWSPARKIKPVRGAIDVEANQVPSGIDIHVHAIGHFPGLDAGLFAEFDIETIGLGIE